MVDMISQELVKTIDPNLLHEMVSQGNTAEIYLYDEGKILKLFREQMPFQAISCEYDKVKIIQRHLQNIPIVYDLVAYQNRFGIVYEQIKGIDMLNLFIKKLGKRKHYSKIMGQIHAKIHEVDIDVKYSVKEKLKDNINEEKELTSEEKVKIIRYLDTLPDGNKVCHFDFHPGNIMLLDNIPIVIDWMTACTGCKAADVARTCLLLRYGEIQHANFMMKLFVHIFNKGIGKLYYKEYKRITGISDEEVEQWILPIAAARLTEWLTDHEKEQLLRVVREKIKVL